MISRQEPIPLTSIAEPLSADRYDPLDYSGLDLCPPMVAPWLLGCHGTRRQCPASAASRGFRRLNEMAAPGTCRHQLAPGQREYKNKERTLNPRAHRPRCRVPYFNSDDHCLHLAMCRLTGRGTRQVHR
jgi:hypothetical protein